MARAGYTDWIWIPFFRRCWAGPDKVEVTHPIIFGRGFLFNRTRQVVTIRRCLFGLTLSKKEIPFSDVTIRLSSRYQAPTSGGYYGGGYSAGSRGGTVYFVEMHIARGKRRLKVFQEQGFGHTSRANRILAAIQKLGISD